MNIEVVDRDKVLGGVYARTLRDFMASDAEAIRITDETENLENIARGIRMNIRRQGLTGRVVCTQKNGCVYVIKKED